MILIMLLVLYRYMHIECSVYFKTYDEIRYPVRVFKENPVVAFYYMLPCTTATGMWYVNCKGAIAALYLHILGHWTYETTLYYLHNGKLLKQVTFSNCVYCNYWFVWRTQLPHLEQCHIAWAKFLTIEVKAHDKRPFTLIVDTSVPVMIMTNLVDKT